MTTGPLHLDASRTPEERADALLAAMTLREKCFQLVSVPVWYLVAPDGGEPAELGSWLERAPGHVSNFALDTPIQVADVVGRLQRTVIEGTRLGIPILVHSEALNGYMSGGHMVFPTPTGLAASWSPELVEEMGEVIRGQMRRVGVRQALSPVMDVALDPRWGRMHETYGEDPYLAAAMSVAYTRGLQGTDLREGVLATSKHFLGYAASEGGINIAGYDGGPRRTRDLFGYPFEAAIQLAGLASVMNSYADVDGVPAAASPDVMTGLLRDTMGFRGFVSSDYMTLEHLVGHQRVAPDAATAGRLGIAAGLDVENPVPFGYGDTLAEEVDRGRVPIEHVDRSVRRVLEAKFALGLFENPYPQERIEIAGVAAEGRELSRELARRSVVLVRNDGVLPLRSGAARIAVIGPHADDVIPQFPTYTYPAFRDMTRFMSGGGLGNMVGVDPGMADWNGALLPATSTEQLVREVLGATSLAEELGRRAAGVSVVRGSTITTELGRDEVDRAVAAAHEADLVVLALGGTSSWFQGERTEGEASDTADIALPAAQVRLAEAVIATGTPVVLVLVQGRPYALPTVLQDVAAIVIAPYGGPFGPSSIAEVLFGEANPSGKLPYSVPRHSGQIPVYHHQHAGSGYRSPIFPTSEHVYLDMSAEPLYAFGHGLSYTSFVGEDATADDEVEIGGTLRVSAVVRNTGERAGAVVVQLYLGLTGLGVSRPTQQLAGFHRIELAPGESSRITFAVDTAQLGFTGLDHVFAVEPGPARWELGFDAATPFGTGVSHITGARRALASSERAFLSTVIATSL